MQVKTITILGLGSIGMRHARNAVSLGYNIIAFDPSDKARERAQDALGGKGDAFESTDNETYAIEAADAAIIASPHKYHLNSLKQCIKHATPCLIEKPISTRIEGLDDVLNTAKDSNITVACGFNLRFRPIVEKAKQHLEQLGAVNWARFICASYLPDWRKDQDYKDNYTNDPIEGGIIFDIAHELDLCMYLLGQTDIVGSYAENSGLLGLKAEDKAFITAKHNSGAVSHILLDYNTQPRKRGFEISTKNGSLSVDLQTHALTILNPDGSVKVQQDAKPDDPNDEYCAELKDFIHAIENKIEPRCNGFDGLANLKNIIKARKMAGLPSA